MTIQKKFQFGTKAQTLSALADRLTIAECCEQVIIAGTDWVQNRQRQINAICSRWPGKPLVVRSSSRFEDTADSSQAGAFLSIVNVAPGPHDIEHAIEQVFDSYGELQAREEVLVQPMVQDVAISGVIFTRDLDTGAPYYVINYDDFSGRTDTVTSGGVSRMAVVHRNNPAALHSQRMLKLIDVVNELESITGTDTLDIEFCVQTDLTVYVLQVRPVAASQSWIGVPDEDVATSLDTVRARLRDLLKPADSIFGQTTLFGEMPDWNPAEMIGSTPRPLALTLYEHLITNKTWSDARAAMGYLHVDKPLMLNFSGRPFIDVRLSLNSFLPAQIDPGLAEKLINYQIGELRENRRWHDKIEFKVAITCLDFSYTRRALKLADAGFSQNEITQLRDGLHAITSACLTSGSDGIKAKLAETDSLLCAPPVELSAGHIQDVRDQLGRTILHGSMPFSILARHGFIGVLFLNSLVERSVLSSHDAEHFMLGVHTIATQLIIDMQKLSSGDITKDVFLKKYGHLRPGTYDITSWRYDERPDLYLSDANGPERLLNDDQPAFSLSNIQRQAIDKLLQESGFDVSADALMQYISTAIYAREQAKFVYSRGISDVLKCLSLWGDECGFSRDDLTYLSVHDLFTGENIKTNMTRNLEAAKSAHHLTRAVRLHHVIAEEADVDVVFPARGQPTFITNKSVTALIKHLHTNEGGDLSGKIILIESADPGFDWIFTHNIAGLITQFGGANSHMAIRCAEFGLPAAIGCGERTFQHLIKGCGIEINCATGNINVH